MAITSDLPIYKVAYDLLDAITDLARNMPRDFKQSIGGKLRDECVEIVTLIFRANCAREKTSHLDALDQHIKHDLRCKHYVRYVDDMVLLHESPQWLNAAHADIAAWLPQHLGLRLNPSKTILQPVDRGVDFVGQVIKPWHRTTRRRTFNEALSRTSQIPAGELFETANSYFGLLRQASHSHHDRARLANVLRYRGHCINKEFTQTYRTQGDHP